MGRMDEEQAVFKQLTLRTVNYKKGFLENSQKSQENTCNRVSFLQV